MQAKHINTIAEHQAYAKIETILKETIGLDSASIGSSTIANAVQRRMVACSHRHADSYLERLHASAGERDALIEEVVIPETWFFRDGKAFEALGQFVVNEWMPEHPQTKLRVLSLPCSTGEEPYTIAMTLMDAGLTAERIHIDAVDISMQAIAQAQRAVYRDNAFRGDDIHFRDRFFHSTDMGYVLDDVIGQPVNFIQANMLDATFMPGQGIYDVIFCRNVMIYFDVTTQTRAVAVLSRLLQSNGILFVGHAESSMILNHGYASEHIPRAFAFRKTKPKVHSGSGAKSRGRVAVQAKVQHHRQEKTKLGTPQFAALFQSRIVAEISDNNDQAAISNDSLEQAFHRANEGNLAEAGDLCESWLQNNEPCVRVYYLLGLIHEATGNCEEAESYLRKVIYLQPDHQEALVHLALLVEQRGDVPAAKILRQRASRAPLAGASLVGRVRDS